MPPSEAFSGSKVISDHLLPTTSGLLALWYDNTLRVCSLHNACLQPPQRIPVEVMYVSTREQIPLNPFTQQCYVRYEW